MFNTSRLAGPGGKGAAPRHWSGQCGRLANRSRIEAGAALSVTGAARSCRTATGRWTTRNAAAVPPMPTAAAVAPSDAGSVRPVVEFPDNSWPCAWSRTPYGAEDRLTGTQLQRGVSEEFVIQGAILDQIPLMEIDGNSFQET